MTCQAVLIMRKDITEMVRTEPPQPSQDDLRRGAEDWLNKEGHPLEMRTYKIFKDAGFRNISQGGYYRDPKELKWREIDLATYDILNTSGAWFTVSYVVECTYAARTPWIVFPIDSLRSDDDEWTWEGHIWSDAASGVRTVLYDRAMRLGEPPQSILLFPEPVSYGVVQSGASVGKKDDRSEPSGAYAKVQQVLSAATAIRSIANTIPERWELILPVVVLDGELFMTRLSESGRAIVTPTEEGMATVYVNRWGCGEEPIAVPIVTEKALPAFCMSARKGVTSLQTLMPRLISEARECKKLLSTPTPPSEKATGPRSKRARAVRDPSQLP